MRKSDLHCLFVAILPPNLEALVRSPHDVPSLALAHLSFPASQKERLVARGTETPESLEKRMKLAEKAMEYGSFL